MIFKKINSDSMREIKLKFFLPSDINRKIKKVESLVLKEEADSKVFVNVDKLRYISIDYLKKQIIAKTALRKKKSTVELYPLKIKKILKLLYQALFHKIKFCSNADMINVRNNLSLFYINKRFRVKVFLKTGIRDLTEFKNEYNTRKKVEKADLLHVPKLLAKSLDRAPFYFIDEIVYGEMVNWTDPRGSFILKDVLKKMWKFYQSTGIVWNSLYEKGIDIPKLVHDFRSGALDNSYSNLSIDLDKILTLEKKFIPSALIHGDLSLGNIIATSSRNYLIDWELSRHDVIIKDLYKTLIRKWELFDELNCLMSSEITNIFPREKNSALSLHEQLLLEHFLRANSSKKTLEMPYYITEYVGK